jgi:endonuclease YncB( thermonuclease family)
MSFLIFTLPAMIVLSANTSDPTTRLAPENVLVGKVTPTDGDSLRMGEKRIRLFGIDAVETGQMCTLDGEPWKCGRASKAALERVPRGRTVKCEVRDMDRGRYVSACKVGGLDINRHMVRRGWAVAYKRYSLDYLSSEVLARRQASGLWNARVKFENPHAYRARLRREQASARIPQTPPSSDCLIKGNVSRSGTRIFHSPGQRDYQKTSIDLRAGERWFCSANEATDAGWRAAKR